MLDCYVLFFLIIELKSSAKSLQGFDYTKKFRFRYCIMCLQYCYFMAVEGDWFFILDNHCSYVVIASIGMDIKMLLNSGYANKVSRATMRFISSNASCSTSVYLNFTFFDVSSIKGCSKCDRWDHISL